jgi:predicted lipoprotein
MQFNQFKNAFEYAQAVKMANQEDKEKQLMTV